jgi:TPR repeat protein
MNRILPWPKWLPLLLLALVAWPAGAAQVEDPAGLENLRKTAENGDAEAMLELGILYEFGFRMPDNKAPAHAWYRLSAEIGNAKAVTRQAALRATMSTKELEDANKLYAEYAAIVRKPAPVATPVPAVPVAPAPEAAPTSAPK